MRMAGKAFNLSELPQSEPEFKEVIIQQTPAIELDPSTLDMTVPEMRPGPYIPGQDSMRDKYILHDPRSGVAFNPKLMIMNAIKREVMDRPVGAGSTLQDAYMRGEPGVVNPGIPDTVRPSDSDDAYMELMRSGFV